MKSRWQEDNECKTCDNYRWIASRCVLDRDELHEGGYTCSEWVKIRAIITRRPEE